MTHTIEKLTSLSFMPLQTEFTFFDITPLGRILNRFSSDTYTIDDTLPFILNILLAQMAGLIGKIFPYVMPGHNIKYFESSSL